MQFMKAILVIDMPKGCCECNCAIDLCHGTIPSQEWYDKRPSWCPLRPLPEKGTMENVEPCEYNQGFVDGRNHTIDLITGETE